MKNKRKGNKNMQENQLTEETGGVAVADVIDEVNTVATVEEVEAADDGDEDTKLEGDVNNDEGELVEAKTGQSAEVVSALETIAALEAQLDALRAKKSGRIASGSKPRANVTYTLLKKPVALHKTPQVAQLQQIIFDPKLLQQFGVAPDAKEVKISEPALFAMIEAGAKSGMLKSSQPPIRVFQYYRSKMLHDGNLIWA